jgi:hypothetical protein
LAGSAQGDLRVEPGWQAAAHVDLIDPHGQPATTRITSRPGPVARIGGVTLVDPAWHLLESTHPHDIEDHDNEQQLDDGFRSSSAGSSSSANIPRRRVNQM